MHEQRATLTLLGYCALDHLQLIEDPRAWLTRALSTLDLDSLCSKTMPATWQASCAWRFEARVCPVVRISGRGHAEQPREVDAFLRHCWQEDRTIKIEREAVYRDWLAAELKCGDAAVLLDANVTRFRRTRLFRRDRSSSEALPRMRTARRDPYRPARSA